MPEFYYIKRTPSTNKHASELLSSKLIKSNFTVIWTNNQTSGKGIYNSRWYSDKNKNLTFSLVFFPEDLLITDNYLISMTVSLAICEYLSDKNLSPKIKWPNDILIDGKKICGILIANSLLGDKVKSSVIGIGFNVNQSSFNPEIEGKACSLSTITGKNYNVENELKDLCCKIENRLKALKSMSAEDIKKDYLSLLLNYNVFAKYKTKSGLFIAKITDVNYDGKIKLERENGKVNEYYFKEVEFL